MTRPTAAAALLGALLAGCGANPLLKMAASDYQPLRPGSRWTYVTPSGAVAFVTTVLPGSAPDGKGLVYVSNYAPLTASTSTLLVSGASVVIVSAGGMLDRKLPYVIGNRWDLPGSASLTATRTVDGYENINTPAGSFVRCFRLKDEFDATDPVSGLVTTTGRFTWAAPDIGDVQYADVDSAGNVSITAKLDSYSLGH